MKFPFKKKLAVSILCFTAAVTVSAQIDMPGMRRLNSPQINGDGTVTFRFVAPKASKVQVTGDFLPTEKKEVRLGDRKNEIVVVFRVIVT